MKCTSCNERLGNTRCEGCNTLFCLPCMIKHHDGLTQQFQSLTNIRNEVKESLDISQSTLIKQQQLRCFFEIEQWESQMAFTIRMIAANARKEVTDIVTKYMKNINQNLEQISTLMQQREKEQNYIENDIETMKNQLNELKDEINNINRKVEVDFSKSTNINWNTLIRVIETNSVNQAASSHEIVEKKSQKDIYEPDLDFPDKCLKCNQRFNNLGRSRFCSPCEFKIQNDPVQPSTSRQQNPPRTRSTNLYSPAYDTRQYTIISPTSNQRPLAKIICSRCNSPNLPPNHLQRSDYRCSACGNLLF